MSLMCSFEKKCGGSCCKRSLLRRKRLQRRRKLPGKRRCWRSRRNRPMLSKAKEAAARWPAWIGMAPPELRGMTCPMNLCYHRYLEIKGIICAAVGTRDMHICIAFATPAVVAARRSRWGGNESSVARPEQRNDAKVTSSEVVCVKNQKTSVQRVGAEQWPHDWEILGRPATRQTPCTAEIRPNYIEDSSFVS
jgi:hypothetical protein